jgi:DNA (cytosine-5)-methyltransferase 1
LRSPKASEGDGGTIGEAEALKRGNTVGVRDQVIDLVAAQGMQTSRADLLPTPAVGHVRNHDEPIDDYLQRRQDYLNGKTKGMPGASLGVAVRMEMLPTPAARDHKDGQAEHERDGVVQTDTVARAIFNSGEVLLGTPRATASESSSVQVETGAPKGRIEDQVKLTDWGKFEPAIRRWEQVLNRPAPAPTKPDGKDGNHRLSAEFTEWMMGLPEGWICAKSIGLKRNEQLKAAGNGVVPQQAKLALEILGLKEILVELDLGHDQ